MRGPSRTAGVLLVLALAAVYVALAKLGFLVAVVAEQVTLVWLPSGLSLAALILLGRALWPGVFLGALVANAMTDAPLWTAGVIAAGNTLEAVLGAWFLEQAAFFPRIRRLRDATALIGLAALLSTAVGATVGATTLCTSGVSPWGAFATVWRDWWVGDAVGDLVLAPLLLSWSSARPARLTRRGGAEIVALLGAMGVVCAVAFGPSADFAHAYPLHYLVFPLVIWSALRMGPRGTSAVVFVTTAVAVTATVFGRGYFSAGPAEERLLMLQLFTLVVAGTGLLLAGTIAERDDTHEGLRVAGEQHRLALDAAKIGDWDWNLKSGEVRWSPNLEPMHGLQPGTFGGTLEAFLAVVHPDDREFVQQAIVRALEHGIDYQAEFRNVHAEGTHWILGKGTVLRGASGEPIRMIGIGMDITERRRLEDELRARAHQLAEQDRRKDEFLAILSHELRNPLAPVTTALALLEAKQHDPHAVASLRRVIERQIWHLVRLVDDLLETSRISTGKIQVRKQRIELREVALAAVEAVQDLVSDRSQDLEVETGAQPILIDGDPTRLSQVIFNLLNNASTYTPEGGRIQLALRRDGEEVVLIVSDNGVGMSPDMIRQAFELFARGTGPEHAGSGGLGVGLALVRRLIELHGGSVSAHSEGPGLGTEVTVRLPAPEVAERPAEGRDRPSLHAKRAAVQHRILVVDDNVDAAETLAALLELQGHEVAVAHDGERALERVRESVPDMVLLDLGMPGMDGYEVARALRDNPSTRGVRIIAVSGYGRGEDRARTRQAGFDMHLVKPVDPEVLRKVVEGPSPSRDPAV